MNGTSLNTIFPRINLTNLHTTSVCKLNIIFGRWISTILHHFFKCSLCTPSLNIVSVTGGVHLKVLSSSCAPQC